MTTSAYLNSHIQELAKTPFTFNSLIMLNSHSINRSDCVLPLVWFDFPSLVLHGWQELSPVDSQLKYLLPQLNNKSDAGLSYVEVVDSDSSTTEFSLEEARMAIDLALQTDSKLEVSIITHSSKQRDLIRAMYAKEESEN